MSTTKSTLIDVFRGLDMIEMQTTESCDHQLFNHRTYQDKSMSYADTIFPCFMFISGLTLNPIKQVPLKKNAQLIGLGCLFNTLPMIAHGEKFRPLGVLQRHALSSIVLNTLTPLKLRNSNYYPFIMSGLWLGISTFGAKNPETPFDNEEDTAQQRIDKPFFKNRQFHPNFDPEGLLGTLMSSVTLWSGYWFQRQNFTNLQSLSVGLGFLGAGNLLAKFFPTYLPVSKPLWTPPFVLLSSGWSILRYTALKVAFPYLPSALIKLLQITGRKTLEVYFMGEILVLLVKYQRNNQANSSLWGYLKEKLNSVLPEALTHFALSAAFDLSLVGFAILCDYYNLSIRLF